MDDVLVSRVCPLATFFAFYCLISVAVRWVVEAPPKLASTKEQHDYYGQHVSLLHSILAVVSALYVFFYEGGIDYHLPTLPRHTVVLAVRPTQHSLSYFCYDMIYGEVYGLHNLEMRLHHLCVVFGGAILFFSPLGGSFGMSNLQAVCVITTEISNPFQQLRFILKLKQQDNTLAFQINEGIFCAIFIFNRAVMTTFVIYNVMLTEIGLHIKACMATVYGLGFFWIYIILSLIAKKLKASSKQNSATLLFVSILGWTRRHVYVLWGVILAWTLFLTVGTRMLEWPHFHLQVGKFIIA